MGEGLIIYTKQVRRLKKIWFKIGTVALSLMGALMATGVESLVWGPVIHQKIVAGARNVVEEGGIRGVVAKLSPLYMLLPSLPTGVWPMKR